MKKNTFALKGPKGVTLIELSVVIAVILVLISVLFIGAKYYRDSAGNAACRIAQSSLQKTADSYMNISGSTSVNMAGLTGTGLPFPTASAQPSCPGDGTLSFTATSGAVSAVGCSGNDPDHTDIL